MKRKAVILGAGITGLTTGWKLAEAGFDVTLVEKEPAAGGQARTLKHDGFLLDLGAHKLHTVMGHIEALVLELLEGDLLRREKRASILYGKSLFPFPVGVRDMVRQVPPHRLLYFVSSFLRGRLGGVFARKAPTTYEEWFLRNYGRGIYEAYVKEATEKVWGMASTLSPELAIRRVTSPTLVELVRQYLLRRDIGRVTSAEHFWYPKYGCQMLVDRLVERLTAGGGRIRTGTTVCGVELGAGRATALTLDTGARIELGPADVVVSTIPKADFVGAFGGDRPADVSYGLAMLRERNLLLTYVFLDQERAMEDNWRFFPERRFLFNRLSEPRNSSPHTCPAGKTVLCAETTFFSDQVLSPRARQHVTDEVVGSLCGTGLIRREKVIGTHSLLLEHAYPVWDVEGGRWLPRVLQYIEAFENLYSVGRQGGFVYGGIADCMDVGLVTSRFIAEERPKRLWPAERTRFDTYVVID